MPLRHHCILKKLSHDAIHMSFSLPTSSQSRFRSKIYLRSLESGRLIPVKSGHSLAKWPTLELQFIFPTSRLNLTCCSDNIHLSHIQNHHRRHSCWMVTTISHNVITLKGSAINLAIPGGSSWPLKTSLIAISTLLLLQMKGKCNVVKKMCAYLIQGKKQDVLRITCVLFYLPNSLSTSHISLNHLGLSCHTLAE